MKSWGIEASITRCFCAKSSEYLFEASKSRCALPVLVPMGALALHYFSIFSIQYGLVTVSTKQPSYVLLGKQIVRICGLNFLYKKTTTFWWWDQEINHYFAMNFWKFLLKCFFFKNTLLNPCILHGSGVRSPKNNMVRKFCKK